MFKTKGTSKQGNCLRKQSLGS